MIRALKAVSTERGRDPRDYARCAFGGNGPLFMVGEHERFMRMALEEAARGKAQSNVAVGSVIVQDATVVARGRNLVPSTFGPTAHAETVAL